MVRPEIWFCIIWSYLLAGLASPGGAAEPSRSGARTTATKSVLVAQPSTSVSTEALDEAPLPPVSLLEPSAHEPISPSDRVGPRLPPSPQRRFPGELPCWFCHTDPDDPYRSVGFGEPLVSTSWRNRPWHFGWFTGTLIGDALMDDLDQQSNFFGGYRLGWDFDHYWGTELRIGWAYLPLADAADGRRRSAENVYTDVHLVYYPWGDARWRPYASFGLGIASFEFEDNQQRDLDEALVHIPLALGVKWMAQPWLAVRVAAEDNLALGSGDLSSMHNFSLVGGFEFHWGRSRVRYFP